MVAAAVGLAAIGIGVRAAGAPAAGGGLPGDHAPPVAVAGGDGSVPNTLTSEPSAQAGDRAARTTVSPQKLAPVVAGAATHSSPAAVAVGDDDGLDESGRQPDADEEDEPERGDDDGD